MLLEHQGQKSFKALPLFKEFCSECVGNICFCNVSSRRNFKWFPKQTRQKQGYLQCFHKTTCKKIKNVFKQNSRFFSSCSSVEKSIIPSSGLVGGIGYWVLEIKWGRQSGPKNALLQINMLYERAMHCTCKMPKLTCCECIRRDTFLHLPKRTDLNGDLLAKNRSGTVLTNRMEMSPAAVTAI